MYIPTYRSPGGVPFPWARTGTAAAVYSYIRTAVLCFCFFVRVIETLIVVACHVLFVTTVWISENELRESINIIIMMLISAHVFVVLYSWFDMLLTAVINTAADTTSTEIQLFTHHMTS